MGKTLKLNADYGGDNVALCDFCFRDKTPLQPVYPRATANVCKACGYQIERVIGFLRHSGIALVAQSELSTRKAPLPPKVAKHLRKQIGVDETPPLSPST